MKLSRKIPAGKMVAARIKARNGKTYPAKVKKVNGRVRIFVTPGVAAKIKVK